MGVIALTGRDSHKVNDRILNNFGPGDCVVIEYEGDLMTVKKGKNGNAIYALNEAGKMVKTTYVFLAGSPDDKFFQGLLASLEQDPAGFVFMTGESTKRIGGGDGSVTSIPYLMTGGVIRKKPGMKDNADGDAGQALVTWEVTYGDAQRTIG